MFSIDSNYIVKNRRQLHMYPETDFDMPRTVALIKQELEAMGIPYTEQYGEGSVVGYINPNCKNFTIGIRADTDALNMDEVNDIPYKSRIPGKMHACGHDAHTAMLLGAAKALKEMENTLDCRVLLVFQPSEEGIKSGAGMMLDNGIADEIDVIIAQHVSPELEIGDIGLAYGYVSACSRHFTIEITGKSAHAAAPHTGIDALAIAMRMYNAIQLLGMREVNPKDNIVCSVNKLEAGTTHNVVAAQAVMKGTIRTFDLDVSRFLIERIEKIGKGLAEETGATITVHGPLKSACVYNNPYLTERMHKTAEKVVGAENVKIVPRRYGSEDFSLFGQVIPAVMFRLGVGNKEKGIISKVHYRDFMLDEDALQLGAKTLVQFVLDHQSNIDCENAKESDERNGKC